MKKTSSRCALWLAIPMGALACTVPPSSATITIEAPTEVAAEWQPVADYLDHRCGSLICHGDPQRNLVIYGCNGLRDNLDGGPQYITGCPPPPAANMSVTTATEYGATYRSLVGLEPQVMSDVVADKGADPDLLTFIRKARGEEAHKGGTLVTPGDAQDTCMTSWLTGSTNTAACAAAIASTP